MGFSRAPRVKNVLIYNISRVLLLVICLTGLIVLKPWRVNKQEEIFMLRSIENSPEIKILSGAVSAEPRDRNCNYFNCFNVYRCGHSVHKLSIYIYPIYR